VFPAEVNEMIFYHLSGNELKKCTLISLDWEQYIRSSRKCMNKFRLRWNIKNDVWKSNHKCQNVSIECSTSSNAEREAIYEFLRSGNLWKSVQFKGLTSLRHWISLNCLKLAKKLSKNCISKELI